MKSVLVIALSLLALAQLSYSQLSTTGTALHRARETATSSKATPTTVDQATQIQSGYPAATTSGATYSNNVDTAGGASGSDSSSFSLSKGGLIAIIVVVVVVAVFGIASIVLWVVAKRRQWNIRASIKRASRRMTGRAAKPPTKDELAKRKRSGVVAGSKRPGYPVANPPGQKRGVAVQVTDVEKGRVDNDEVENKQAKSDGGWKARLLGNNWR